MFSNLKSNFSINFELYTSVAMSIQKLPDELILLIYQLGGPEVFSTGISESCKRFWSLSHDEGLWGSWLLPLFTARCLTPQQVLSIPDVRSWYLAISAVRYRIIQTIDEMVIETHKENDPQSMEGWVTRIVRHRLSCMDGLMAVKANPRTLAHYHWAHWLIDISYRLEGLRRLLDFTCQDNWGNGDVEVPLEQVLALSMLRLGRSPEHIMSLLFVGNDLSSDLPQEEEVTENHIALIASLVDQACTADLGTKRDYFSALIRATVLVHIARGLGYTAEILSAPMSTYAIVRLQSSEVFVDFMRGGVLRTAEDVRLRLIYQNATAQDVKRGVSLYDILSTTYVWHSMRTSSRRSVLELVDHAARDNNVTSLRQYPQLYENLVTRIVERNIAEVDAPVRRSRANSISSGGTVTTGKVCQLVGGGEQGDGPQCCVVLEEGQDSCLVLRGRELKRIAKQMLNPGYDGKVISVAGLLVPDIEADILVLGQYFVNYNPSSQRFS